MHVWVSKNGLIDPFMHTNEHFTKTGSGQTYRESTQKRSVFPQGVVEMYPPADETILDIGTEEEKPQTPPFLLCAILC
eukprot:COSAG06_NODE_9095_length_1987_cov_25202.194915_3_plen_78_part_00